MTQNWRLQLIYSDQPMPSPEKARELAQTLDGIERVYYAHRSTDSDRAAMWTRDPLKLNLQGRIAIDLNHELTAIEQAEIVELLGGRPYLCERHEPLSLSLGPAETFEGTVQICCFRKLRSISEEQLTERWLEQHTPIALETQCTVGYIQNRVRRSTDPLFDAIVEEYFPPAAATSAAVFFNAPNDPEVMKANIARMTQSTARFLELATAEVIHLSDTRIL